MLEYRTALKFVAFFLILSYAILHLGCKIDHKVRVIKLGHGLDPSHPVHQAMEFLAERVYEKSDGRMRVDVYPSEQLGSERECLELLQIGSLAMTKVSCSVIEGFVPEMSVLSLPYIFRDEEHRFKVLEGKIGRELLLAGERYWLRGLCYYDAGTRSFYTKDRPILSPSDLAGLKIRTQESPTSMKMVQALGGSATPIAWGELYSALQQGVVDGAENNPPSFHLSRHYEVCKFYSLDEHTGVPDILVISTKFWDDLSPEFQQWLQEAANESEQHQKRLWKEATQRALEEVQRSGVKIYHPNKKPFIEGVDSLFEEYRKEPRIYGLIHRIREVR
ncbi:C4-dicarboxylate ABC transporter substrate-binding protein [candidate division WOR-1 bacterium DG_54_3]|uniref:C4-dicarboxylate ABC transporter substrate-binding protein n=1 Tax=candidate division WOR-1 bacterium DG_54_3 TaxID=1703775 RepID=A0A0S7Y5G7_UNCSA|nr:MAG: C4-dicarboxylate ABC transporter substrate-binding protein [candidate division WOR-1 bacterium DG_54_3]